MKRNDPDDSRENELKSQREQRLFWFDLVELAMVLGLAMVAIALYTT